MAVIRTPPNQRIYPLWNTQQLADTIELITGANSFGTYLGHSPTPERSVDVFTTIPMPRENRVLGDIVAEYVLSGVLPNGISVWNFFGVRYIIWRQRINWNDGKGWIRMSNRGSDTKNHFDHDHISTNVIPAPSGHIPEPISNIGDNDVLIVNVKDTGIFLLRGSEVIHLLAIDDVFAWVRAGAVYQDRYEMEAETFKTYTGWDSGQAGIGGSGLEEGGDPAAEQEVAEQAASLMKDVRAGLNDIHDEYVKSLQVG